MPRHVRPEVRRGRVPPAMAASIMSLAWTERAPLRPKRWGGKEFAGTTAYTWYSECCEYTFNGNTYFAAFIPPEYWALYLEACGAVGGTPVARDLLGVLVNAYGPIPKDAKARARHKLGAHRDDEPINDPAHDVLMVALCATPGVTRDLWVYDLEPNSGKTVLTLTHGDVLQADLCNAVHSVQWRKHNSGQRWVTVTFRVLRPPPGSV